MHDRLGIRERMVDVGQRVIRTAMPEQHQRFFAQLPFMLVGSVDAAGRPWASVLVGQPGFVQAPDAKRLDFRARPIPGDPLAEGLAPGRAAGLPGHRAAHASAQPRQRPCRGVAMSRASASRSSRSVGNCPQYIQGREFEWVRDATDLTPRATEALRPAGRRGAGAHRARRHAVRRHPGASRADGPDVQTGRGADVSHRGGRPGFVKIEDEHTLLVPDFTGNFFFMTLGNLQLNPRAGVLFIDFDTRRPAHADRHRRGGVGR